LGDAWGTLNERGQLSPRPCRRGVLERRASREHQTDDHSRELLAECQRAHHRDKSDRIDPHVVVHGDRAHDLECQFGGEERDSGAPDLITGRTAACEMQQSPGRDRQDGNPRDDASTMLDRAGNHATDRTIRRRATRNARRGRGCRGGNHSDSIAVRLSSTHP
jgi:hypothetical protein